MTIEDKIQADIEFSQEEYLGLLELAFEVSQALEGKQSEDGRWPDAQYLALKLFAHATSAHWLYLGTNSIVPRSTSGSSFFDFASIAVLARAALETYLTFFEVFVAPSNEDEFEFQYCLWHLVGQVVLEGLEPSDESLRENYEGAQADISEIRERLSATNHYSQLTSGQQGRVLNGWRSRNWQEVASAAGLGFKFIRRIYSYYSSFVHADGLAASQLFTAQTKEDQISHSEMHLTTIMIVLSKFILQYASLFGEASKVLLKFSGAHMRAQIWSGVASRLE